MAPLTVVYDGKCRLCARSAAVLRCLDWLRRLAYLDANAPHAVCEAFPWLSSGGLLREMHVVSVTGEVWSGYDGFRRLAWELPLLWPLAPLLYLPGARRVGQRVYGYVAANRGRDWCGSDACLDR